MRELRPWIDTRSAHARNPDDPGKCCSAKRTYGTEDRSAASLLLLVRRRSGENMMRYLTGFAK